MLGGADNPNGELLSYIIGADNWPDYLCITSVAHTREQVDCVWGQL